MDLGKEQDIPVIARPFSSEEWCLNDTGTCITIQIEEDELIFSTFVRGQLGGNEVFAKFIPRILPGYERRLVKARQKAARRILAHYASRDEEPSE